SLPDSKYYFIFLAFVYIGTLLGNIFLIMVIWQSEALHTPKYMVVFSLSIVDVSHITALIPKCVSQFLFDSRILLTVTYTITWIYTKIDGNTRILNTSLSAVLPPLLNPIIYTLKTEEVLEQIRKFLRKHSIKPLW
ncbi:olfactory receptor 5B12-like, partial [Scleropages formosus]